MLRVLGVASAEELFSDVPESVRLNRPLDIPEGMGEIELMAHVRRLAAANIPAGSMVSFAGAGCYDHYTPSVVDHVVRRPEFFTAYTPYQPEVSQGTLQAIFEYQTMTCELTGMEVANASMYDGATAFVEAALMACRLTRRSQVICVDSVHPEWQRVLATYADAGHLEVATAGHDEAPALLASGQSAALLVQSPDFFGRLWDVRRLADAAHAAGALLVVAVNPVLLGVLEPPGRMGADIVVAEGQTLGNTMSFGGPGLGMFSCREAHVRQMPGRLVGKTLDADGALAYVLTLSTREQHIRREKATSNICSNHALNALAAGAYLAAVGATGLAEIAGACVAKAHYLRDRLLETNVFSAPWDSPFANEFVVRYHGDALAMHDALFKRGYVAGVIISELDSEWPAGAPVDTEGLVMFAVTEKRTRDEIDAFVGEVAAS